MYPCCRTLSSSNEPETSRKRSYGWCRERRPALWTSATRRLPGVIPSSHRPAIIEARSASVFPTRRSRWGAAADPVSAEGGRRGVVRAGREEGQGGCGQRQRPRGGADRQREAEGRHSRPPGRRTSGSPTVQDTRRVRCPRAPRARAGPSRGAPGRSRRPCRAPSALFPAWLPMTTRSCSPERAWARMPSSGVFAGATRKPPSTPSACRVRTPRSRWARTHEGGVSPPEATCSRSTFARSRAASQPPNRTSFLPGSPTAVQISRVRMSRSPCRAKRIGVRARWRRGALAPANGGAPRRPHRRRAGRRSFREISERTCSVHSPERTRISALSPSSPGGAAGSPSVCGRRGPPPSPRRAASVRRRSRGRASSRRTRSPAPLRRRGFAAAVERGFAIP